MSALEKILAERKRQTREWGEQDHHDEWWLPILVEEVGELSEAMLKKHFRYSHKSTKEVRQEVIQIAAVALAWVECHERKWPSEEQP